MKKLKTISMTLLMLGLAATTTPAEPSATDKLADIMKRGKLVIAINSDYPPQSELIKGVTRGAGTLCSPHEHIAAEVVGFDVDVAKETAKRLGVEACFVTPLWSEIVSGRWANRWDIVFASLSITTERLEFLYFAQPYSSEPSVFYVHNDNHTFKNPADLSGKKIGVCAGCTFEYYLEGTLILPGQKIDTIVRNSDIIAYDTESKNFGDLALGDGVKLDAVLANIFIGNQAIATGMPIRQLGQPVFYTHIAPAIDRKQTKNPIAFIHKINEIIRQLHDDGTLQKLAARYYQLNTDIITPAQQFDLQALGQ